jgi:hypothetical protein
VKWRVTSLKEDGFLRAPEKEEARFKDRVSYSISLSSPALPSPLKGKVIWFEHAFGVWGQDPKPFLKLITQAKEMGKYVVSSFHTVHFQSKETPEGIQLREKKLLKEVLPYLDLVTVFTEGAYQAFQNAFPEWWDKVRILKHGVHLYSQINQSEVRQKLFYYLVHQSSISPSQKEELKANLDTFLNKNTILIGNAGFITRDKGIPKLYQLRELLAQKLQSQVIAIYIGRIQSRQDRKIEETLPVIEELKKLHDGKQNFFIETYLPEEIYPLVFQSLDFVVFWPRNATQSGRIAHAQGGRTLIVGRDIEGIGETLRKAHLPVAKELGELAEIIKELVLKPKLRQEHLEQSWKYALQFSYKVQAQKHLLLAKALGKGNKIPQVD